MAQFERLLTIRHSHGFAPYPLSYYFEPLRAYPVLPLGTWAPSYAGCSSRSQFGRSDIYSICLLRLPPPGSPGSEGHVVRDEYELAWADWMEVELL